MLLDQIGRPHKSPPKYKQLTLTQTVLLPEVLRNDAAPRPTLSEPSSPTTCPTGTERDVHCAKPSNIGKWYLSCFTVEDG
jgi:hypothetical protein